MSLRYQGTAGSITAIIFGAVGAITTMFIAFYADSDAIRNPKAVPEQRDLAPQVKALHDEVLALKTQLAAATTLSAASAPLPPEALTRQLNLNAVALNALTERIQRIEQAILTSPAKALEIPLLQRDMESLKQNQAAQTAAQKEAIDRIYDQNKWLLGGVSISILALAIGGLLKVKQEQE